MEGNDPKAPAPDSPEAFKKKIDTLEELLAKVRAMPDMTDEERIVQKINWVWGNLSASTNHQPLPETREAFERDIWREEWKRANAHARMYKFIMTNTQTWREEWKRANAHAKDLQRRMTLVKYSKYGLAPGDGRGPSDGGSDGR